VKTPKDTEPNAHGKKSLRRNGSSELTAYPMSIGEIVSMYDNGEIIIDPEFQRLFRWDISQKSKLVESLLLGIPVPSIFVFEEREWHVGTHRWLQRIATILEFMGETSQPRRWHRAVVDSRGYQISPLPA